MSESVLVDTDVVSYLLKGDSRAESYSRLLDGKTLVVSFMTVAELERWALEKDWGQNRVAEMRVRLRNFVVYPFNNDLCVKWAEISADASRAGRSIDCADAWIAATALLHGIPIVTHNRRHFASVPGLSVLPLP